MGKERFWFSNRFHVFLCKSKYAIVVFWALSLGFGAWLGPPLLTATSFEFAPPKGYPTEEAQKVLEREFPQIAWHVESIVMFQGHSEGDTVVIPQVAAASKQVADWFWSQTIAQTVQLEGYDYFYDQGLYRMAEQFKSKNNHTSLMVMTTNGSDSGISDKFASGLRSKMETIQSLLEHTSVDMSLVGMPAMLHDAQSVAEVDLATMDGIVIPIAMAVLALILASFRLMIIPLLTMGTSTLTSFMLVYPLTFRIHVISFAPMIMMSAVIAMSIDYSLFLLRRFREEVENSRNTNDCVKIMIRTAGETIFISGLTISICFFGLAFFPMDILMSIGVGTGIAIMMTLIVNLTLTPAILLIFPEFFRVFITRNTWMELRRIILCQPRRYQKAAIAPGADHGVSKRVSPAAKQHENVTDGDPLKSGDDNEPVLYDPNVVLSLQADSLPPQSSQQRKSFWNRAGQVLVQWPVIIFIVVCAIAIPFVLHSMRLTVTLDQNQFIPVNAPSSIAYRNMQKDFSAGFVSPMTLSISTGKVNGVKSQEFFDNSVLALKIIAGKMAKTNMTFFNGVTYLEDQEVFFPLIQLWLDMPEKPPYHSEEGRSYRFLWNSLVNHDNSSIIVMVTTSFDPMTFAGKTWLEEFRSVLKNYVANATKEEAVSPFQEYEYHLSGAPEIISDMVDSVYSLFPLMVAVTTAVVYLIAAIMFRSVFVPFRMLITLGLTCAWVYGMSVFVYDDGLLYHLIPDMKNYPYIFWVVPILVFPVIVGLGLDYDVFLMTRVVEYRMLGFSTKGSILNGLYKTGSIITAAGIIMCIAFSGLMFSHMIVLNQFSFFLCFAVLLDTFVVRTILVPVIMGMAGKANWWPRKMPEEKYGDALCEEVDCIGDA